MRAKRLKLVADIIAIMKDIGTKMTVRQIYYQLVSKHIIENSKQSYKSFDTVLTIARKEGLISPFDIIDHSKPVLIPSSWGGIPDFMETVKNSYRRDVWAEQSNQYVEVWLEKDALRGIVEPITDKYGCCLCIGRGYQSITNKFLGIRRFEEKADKERCILYLGDFDPTGLDIPRDIKKCFMDQGSTPDIKKIALTKEQVTLYNLPPDKTKKSDPRSKGFVAEHGDIAVELDALNPLVLRNIIEEAIKKHLNPEEFDKTIEKEKMDITTIQTFIDTFKEEGHP